VVSRGRCTGRYGTTSVNLFCTVARQHFGEQSLNHVFVPACEVVRDQGRVIESLRHTSIEVRLAVLEEICAEELHALGAETDCARLVYMGARLCPDEVERRWGSE